MIRITDKNECCGCGACTKVCPKHCIDMEQDSEGFLYPKVNESACIDCGLCEKCCTVINPYQKRDVTNVFAAINQNEEIRKQSSSGGVFTLLAEKVIEEKGVVFGIRFDSNWEAVIDSVETKEELAFFRGSKYLQSRTGDSYEYCKELLDGGRKVLFSGTPCQIAGLLHYLRKPYENLITVDFICHGTPSPEVWRRYLDEIIIAATRAISDVQFRNKKNGWQRFYVKLEYLEGNKEVSMISEASENPYMKAFLSDLILRPSCYTCAAKAGRSGADITIADFWGIEKIDPTMYDDQGTSLVLVHSEKGQSAFPQRMMTIKKEPVESLRHNRSYYISSKPHPRRSYFFAEFPSSSNIHELIAYSLQPSLKHKLAPIKHPIVLFKKIGNMLLSIVKKSIGGGQKSDYQPFDVFESKNVVLHQDNVQFRNKSNGWNNSRLVIKCTLKEK